MKTFLAFFNESKEAASQEAASHHATAATHAAEAEKHSPETADHHKALAKHYHSLMLAHRAEAKSKWRVAERQKSVAAADHHFKKSMEHHGTATSLANG